MHDVLEGVCLYVLGKLLYTFIYVKKYFTEDWLNSKMEDLDFGDESNTPPSFKGNRLEFRMHIRTSAAEMLCFVKYLGLLIGEKIPIGDKHWKLYKLLAQIVDILMSPRIDVGMIRDLRDNVEALLKLYIEFYGSLKPKFHNLLH